MADLSGRRLGPYLLEKKLGQGGMGAVYVGLHRQLNVRRAIKVLLPTEVDEAVVERFVREGVISASLRHPNIVEIFDVGEQDEIHFLVMELIDGESLLGVLRQHGALPLDRTIRLLRQMADALDYAHARGVVHRDIKPSNIIVEPNDAVTLIDFGIARAMDEARLTRVGVVVGTFEYMAPEIVTEGGGSPGADRYALGIVAYQMLTGRVPFTGESAHSIMYRQVHDPPPPPRQFRPDLPVAVEEALLRQLAKSPDDRYPSAQAFVDALDAAPRRPAYETSATSISDITRPGFDPPTPGSGQTNFPRPARDTRPVTAATLTPPAVRPLQQPTPAPQVIPAAPYTQPDSGFRAAAQAPATVMEPARKSGGGTLSVILGVMALLLVVGGAVVFVQPLREAVLDPLIGTKTTTTTTPVAQGVTPVVTPAVTQVTPPPAVTPATSTPAAITVTPAVTQVTPQVTPPTPVPPATLTPNQRVATARDAATAGNFAGAIRIVDEVRASNATLPGLDDAEYDIRIAWAKALNDQGNADGAYEQFGAALKLRPNDPAAREGQKQIVLAKNYAVMEANWDKDPEAAIKALEDSYALDAGYRDIREKLYALLIGKADRLIEAGEKEAAVPVLLRAQEVQPANGAAQGRLVSLTPTPVPTVAPPPPPPPPARTTNPGTTNPGTTTAPPNTSSGGTNNSGYFPGSNCPGGVCP